VLKISINLLVKHTTNLATSEVAKGLIKIIFFNYNQNMVGNFTSIDDLIRKYQINTDKDVGEDEDGISLPKEAEPVTSEKFEVKEVVEHKVEEEVRPFVSPRHETIELPPDLKKLGLTSDPSTKFPSYQNIKLPISDEKIIVGLHAPVTSSLRWLATLAVYLLARVHLGLKVVGGKVVRVFRG